MYKISLSLYLTNLNKMNDDIEKLRKFLTENFSNDFELNIIDVLKCPEKTVEENIIATPTLRRKLPEPILQVIGDLSNLDVIVKHLELK